MASSIKSLFILVILFSCIASVFATDASTSENICGISKKTLFDGTQNRDGECVTTDMGEIPDVNKMTSTVILFPKDGDAVNENEAFTIRTKTQNLKTGFFSDPATQYYVFSQTLDDAGFIQGHSHVTVQKIENADEPPDARLFAFFKGLNDPADGNGELNVLVDKGLPAGNYRLCTMVSSFSHQPLLMPVAQRGSQDDCTRFTVNAGAGNGAAAKNAADAGNGGGGNAKKGKGGKGKKRSLRI